jgi:hypothetical protein
LGVVAVAGRYDALSIRSSFSCALPWLAVVDVIAFVVLVHVASLVFLVPVGKLVISDAKIVVGRCVTTLSLFFLHELTAWSSLLFLV